MKVYNIDHELIREKHFNIDDIVYFVRNESKNINVRFIPQENGEIRHSITGENGIIKHDTIDVFKIIPIKIQGLARQYENDNNGFDYFYYDNLEEEMVKIPYHELFISIEEAKNEILRYAKKFDITKYEIN